jgi:TolB protein
MDEQEPYDSDAEQEEDFGEMSRRRLPGCWLLVAVLLIVSLLATSLSGVVWLLSERGEVPTAVPPLTNTPAPVVEGLEAVSVTSTPFSTAVPTPDPNAINRIAFIDDNGQINTIAPDGTGLRRLTDGEEVFNFPAWSPDGQSIAAIGGDNQGAAVFVVEDRERAQPPQSLYFGRRAAPFYLYWSPDSQTVSFLASDVAGMALHLVPADGSTGSQRRTTGGPFYWQWTADSQQLLIHSGFAGEGSRLELIEAAADEDGEQIAPPGYFQAPGISADGRILVYAEEIARADSQVVAANSSTGNNQAQPHAGQVAMSLSPTADLLAYISPDNPEATDFFGPLRLMEVATGQVRLLSREHVAAFFWSPDGRYLAAFIPNLPGGGDINALSNARTTAKAAAQNGLPTFKLVVFDAASGEGRLVWTFTPTFTFLTQLVPFFDQYALSHRLWSPASDALVLPALEDGRSHIYIVPIHGGPQQFLAEGSMSFWSQR